MISVYFPSRRFRRRNTWVSARFPRRSRYISKSDIHEHAKDYPKVSQFSVLLSHSPRALTGLERKIHQIYFARKTLRRHGNCQKHFLEHLWTHTHSMFDCS